MDGKCKSHGKTKYLFVKSAGAKLCYQCVQAGLFKKEIADELYAAYPAYQPGGAQSIAGAIEDISKAMKLLNTSRLSRKAVVALIHDQSRICKRDIEIVLNNLDGLEQDWLKKEIGNGT